MATRSLPRWTWPLAAVALALAGSVFIVQADRAQRRAAFDTDARIVHRLLSQQAVQHDAMLATLTLLQPGTEGDLGPRLQALYPQVLQVLRRDRSQPWPASGGAETAAALAAAEAESLTRRRAVLAQADLARGQFTLVRAGEPASYALRIDLAQAVPWAEWPLPRDGPVRTELRWADQRWVLQPGTADPGPAAAAGGSDAGWTAAKRLAADSQPFEAHVSQPQHLSDVPWLRLLLWCALSVAAVAALAAWQRQRQAARRASELLRVGQVGRLNALGELAAGMAHELNQPLTAVLAGSQAAQRLLDDYVAQRPAAEPPDPDLATARQALDRSVQQARRAGEVVARLRRLVQPADPGAMAQDLSLAAAVLSVLDLLQPQVDALAVHTDLSGLAEALRVRADPVALEQVVHNLVLNALQALERVPAGQRRLVLRSGVQGGQVQLQVRDSGPGFPADALARAFEPFFTTREGGLGLGLSLCETLAAGMGGALSARNHEGGGAELTLLLPQAGGGRPATP